MEVVWVWLVEVWDTAVMTVAAAAAVVVVVVADTVADVRVVPDGI